jgi:hypothetical protein
MPSWAPSCQTIQLPSFLNICAGFCLSAFLPFCEIDALVSEEPPHPVPLFHKLQFRLLIAFFIEGRCGKRAGFSR